LTKPIKGAKANAKNIPFGMSLNTLIPASPGGIVTAGGFYRVETPGE